MKETKVFCVGFAKTGTTTLRKTLKSLGFRVAGYDSFRKFADKQDVTYDDLAAHAVEEIRAYDACQDSPWSILYRDLDRAFPGSKFIHVIRDRDAWIRSALGDFSGHPNPIRKVIYGSLVPEGNEEGWLDAYDRHNAAVTEHFSGRSEDFLQLKLEDLDFETVCRFVGEEYRGQKLPKTNTRFQKRLKKLVWKVTGTR